MAETPLSPHVKSTVDRWATTAAAVTLPTGGLGLLLAADPFDDPADDWLCESPDLDAESFIDDVGDWLRAMI